MRTGLGRTSHPSVPLAHGPGEELRAGVLCRAPTSPMSPPADPQAAVIAFLSDPASYTPPAAAVERVETHCSIVFLAGDRAYKLKRALRYAALDYTTRERRRDACAAELTLNRRTAPDLYLAVYPITRASDGRLAFNGTGPPQDHVVVMRRFAQATLFDRLADSGCLTPSLMSDLGATIARFHQAAAVTPGFGGSDALRRDVAGNDRELAKVATDLDGAAVGTLSHRSRTALDALAPLLDQRATGGKVRRCHGDLRLANICLYQDRPTLFDCIEFSDAVGCIDVLHDLAFLLMDLHLCGRDDLGNAVFNAYLDVAPETEGLRALPLFLAVRAATRSYALAGSAHRQASPRTAARQRALARRHIAAGLAFLAPPPPRLVMIGGGTGDARAALAAGLAGLVPPAPGGRILPLSRGRAAWDEARAVLAARCPVVLEGNFAEASDRAAATALAAELLVPPTGFWLGTEPDCPDRRLWSSVDTGGGGAGALACAAAQLAAPPAPG